MIITKAPVRVPIGGGGTDLPEFYTQYGEGRLSAVTINRFVYCLVRENFECGIRFTGYHNKETVRHSSEIKNPLVRNVLEVLGIDDGIEIVSMSDIRSSCGLGTSSAFTVALISAIYNYYGIKYNSISLAEQARYIERERLAEAGGFQDQYASSIGGGVILKCTREGVVSAEKMVISDTEWKRFFKKLVFFDTSISRRSFEIQSNTVSKIKNNSETINYLSRILAIGKEIEDNLIRGSYDEVGILIHEHWEYKKKYTDNKDLKINKIIEESRKYGSVGGKLMGAGGGGFIMCYSKNEKNKKTLIEYMMKQGFTIANF